MCSYLRSFLPAPLAALLAVASGLLTLVAVATVAAQPESVSIGVDLRDANRRLLGTATLRDAQEGAVIIGFVRGLPAGPHGFHIHEVGVCEPPSFVGTGGHFNPSGKSHGLQNPNGPQLGDLPDLTVGTDGTAAINTLARGVALRDGPSALVNARGSALVIHAGPDDQQTQPDGNSGPIVACGVIAGASAVSQAPIQGLVAASSASGPSGDQLAGQSAGPATFVDPRMVLAGLGVVLIAAGFTLRRSRRGGP
jgi:Cu-Zn family superoxide dismutase